MTIAHLKKRDRLESGLATLEHQLALNKLEAIRSTTNFEKKLETYRKWLKEVGMEGVKYK